jgi:hypothetical protein
VPQYLGHGLGHLLSLVNVVERDCIIYISVTQAFGAKKERPLRRGRNLTRTTSPAAAGAPSEKEPFWTGDFALSIPHRTKSSPLRGETAAKQQWVDPARRKTCLFAVMSLALGYFYSIADDTVNETVFIVDSARPPPGQIAFQRFRLAYAILSIASYILYQSVYPLYCLFYLASANRHNPSIPFP